MSVLYCLFFGHHQPTALARMVALTLFALMLSHVDPLNRLEAINAINRYVGAHRDVLSDF